MSDNCPRKTTCTNAHLGLPAMVKINAHAQLSRRNENAQAAIMVSLVASGRPTVAFSNKVGLCHERTLPENFWKKISSTCCQQNGLFARSKSGRPIFSYFMARARCCLRSITLLFMSFIKIKLTSTDPIGYFLIVKQSIRRTQSLRVQKKIITKIARPR